MGKAVQYPAALGKTCHRPAVVFLIEEKAGLLPVFHIDRIIDAVFADLGDGALRRCLTGKRIPASPLLQPFETADGSVVALKDAGDALPVFTQHLNEQREDQILEPLHPDGERLCHKDVGEPVHREAGETVRLAEDHAAAAQVLRIQHRLAVVPGILDAPPPKGFVKAVVCVAGDKAQTDLALAAV